MVTIDDGTVAFRNGRTVYVNKLLGECSGLDSGFYTLVTTSSGSGLCRGAVVLPARAYGAIGDFVPYKPAS